MEIMWLIVPPIAIRIEVRVLVLQWLLVYFLLLNKEFTFVWNNLNKLSNILMKQNLCVYKG